MQALISHRDVQSFRDRIAENTTIAQRDMDRVKFDRSSTAGVTSTRLVAEPANCDTKESERAPYEICR